MVAWIWTLRCLEESYFPQRYKMKKPQGVEAQASWLYTKKPYTIFLNLLFPHPPFPSEIT
jgi:hypothetical protein